MVCGLHWHWLHDSTIDAGIIQGVATLVPGMLVASIAWRGLEGWRNQLLGERKVHHAEACLVAADEFLRQFRAARAGDVPEMPDFQEGDTPKERMLRRDEVVLQRVASTLADLRQAYRKTTFFIAMPHPDPYSEFHAAFGGHMAALHALYYLEFVDRRTDSDTERRRHQARLEFYGSDRGPGEAKTYPDLPLEQVETRLQSAMDALEDVLVPIMGGSRLPVTLP